MRRSLAALFLVAALLLGAVQGIGCSKPTPPGLVRVTRVIDGDTIEIAGKQHIRYIGVDTPEMSPSPQFWAKEATESNRKLVEGKDVRLERDVSDVDRYGRLLRYVYVGDVMVNLELVKNGHARARAYPPDTRHDRELREAETAARNGKLGMWASSLQSFPFGKSIGGAYAYGN